MLSPKQELRLHVPKDPSNKGVDVRRKRLLAGKRWRRHSDGDCAGSSSSLPCARLDSREKELESVKQQIIGKQDQESSLRVR